MVSNTDNNANTPLGGINEAETNQYIRSWFYCFLNIKYINQAKRLAM